MDLKVTGEEQLQGIKDCIGVSSSGTFLNHKVQTKLLFIVHYTGWTLLDAIHHTQVLKVIQLEKLRHSNTRNPSFSHVLRAK